jgi:negative regulator of flagellin synthesis FlgM
MKVEQGQQNLVTAVRDSEVEVSRKTRERAATDSEDTAATSTSARVELSDQSRGARTAAEIARKTPEVRWEKVQALKEEIESGRYQVDGEEVADKMLRHLVSELIR